jgi:hypothetical protein
MKPTINPYFVQICVQHLPFEKSSAIECLNEKGPRKFLEFETILISVYTCIALLFLVFGGIRGSLFAGILAFMIYVMIALSWKHLREARNGLAWVRQRLDNAMRDEGLYLSFKSTEEAYGELRREFTKKAAVIKYWQKQGVQDKAEACRAAFFQKIKEAVACFGFFDTSGGYRSFFESKGSDEIVVRILVPTAWTELLHLSGKHMKIQDLTSEILKVPTWSTDQMSTALMMQSIIIDGRSYAEIIDHEIRKQWPKAT